MEGGAACLENQQLLMVYRSTAFNVKAALYVAGKEQAKFLGFHKLIAADPVGFLAWTQIKQLPESLDWFDKPWYSDLQHKTTILVGLLNYFRLVPSSSPAAATGFVTWASDEIKEFARNVVRRVDPKEAAEIVEVYLPALFVITGTVLRTVEDSL